MRAVLLAIGILATPAVAQQVGDWTISKIDDGCQANYVDQRSPLPTSLSIAQSSDGKPAIALKNSSWSNEDGKRYPIYLLIDGNSWQGSAIGSSDGVLVMAVSSEIMKAITRGKWLTAFLKVDADNEKPLGQFKLTGSTAAFQAVERCNKASLAEKRLERLYPADPFKR